MIDVAVWDEALGTARDEHELEALMAVFAEELDGDWESWVRYLFPEWVERPFAPHHRQMMEWGWSIPPDGRVDPFVAIWGRGEAKSTLAELLVAALGARRRRRYVLYTCGTQDLADKHVENIGALLESPRFAELYPPFACPQIGKFGNQRAWKRARLSTAGGFTVEAIGLDKMMRGLRLETDRPDLIVLDDVDDGTDSPVVTQRKLERITRNVLPAGGPNTATLAVQNLVLPNGVFARIAGVAEAADSDVLATATVCGPVPAVEGLVLAQAEHADGRLVWRMVGGTPTWLGQDVESLNAKIADWGKTAFLIEAQHEVHRRSGGMFSAWDWTANRLVPGPYDARDPQVRRVRVWDTAATEPTGDNDPDWTAGVLVAVHLGEKRYRIEHVRRFRHSSGRVATLVREQAMADVELYGHEGVWFGVEEEPGPHGRDRARQWVHDILAGLNVRRIPAATSKPVRAEPLANAMENQLVDVVRADWTHAFLAECEAFPFGDHDDQVDSAAHGFNWLQRDLLGGPTQSGVAQMSRVRLPG